MNNSVNFRNYSMLAGKKQDDDWYEWCIFVDSDPETIHRIRSIEYILHPTFPNPVRTVTNKETRFALFSSGWGVFRIGINIEWETGSWTTASHHLTFSQDDWPKKPKPASFSSPQSEEVYNALLHEKFRWRKTATIAKISKQDESTVLEILHEMAKQGLVRKGDFLSIDKKELWASTAVVGLSPHL